MSKARHYGKRRVLQEIQGILPMLFFKHVFLGLVEKGQSFPEHDINHFSILPPQHNFMPPRHYRQRC